MLSVSNSTFLLTHIDILPYNSPTMVSFIDLLSVRYAPIQQSLLHYLSPGSIAKLTCTCRAFGCLWPTLMASEYNINLRLRQFFKDSRAFRSVQGCCNALIIDGYVPDYFDFFGRSDYLMYSLELHCETKLVAPLAEYIKSEGYVEYNPWPYSPFVPDIIWPSRGRISMVKADASVSSLTKNQRSIIS
jgi:hypothetical protein